MFVPSLTYDLSAWEWSKKMCKLATLNSLSSLNIWDRAGMYQHLNPNKKRDTVTMECG